jgi:hypothetical protein
LRAKPKATANAYSANIVITSSLRKGVYDPWAFYLHDALIHLLDEKQ